jgi:hypothetical protein
MDTIESLNSNGRRALGSQMRAKAKDGHSKIVERFQRRVLTQRFINDEAHKAELLAKVDKFVKMNSLLNRVKDPDIKSLSKTFHSKDKPAFNCSARINESPRFKLTSPPDKEIKTKRQVTLEKLSENQKKIKAKLTRLEASERLKLRKKYMDAVPPEEIMELNYQHALRRYEMLPELFGKPKKPKKALQM